jgi:uncharacterized membrane protein YraQ (UPF0718 family)
LPRRACRHHQSLACGEILWPLILGFALSGVIQAVVSHSEMARLLPDDGPRSIAKALALGAASSSCSYAAVAIARSLFRKGANFTAAMAFEMASTNLVVELSIIMLVFLGWQLMLAEFVGAPIMVAFLVILFRRFGVAGNHERAIDARDVALRQAIKLDPPCEGLRITVIHSRKCQHKTAILYINYRNGKPYQ